MKELIQYLPYDYIPNILRFEDISNIPLNHPLSESIAQLMTPREILQLAEFSSPEVITPEKYPDFNSLLYVRQKIRDLKLLSIKTEEEYTRYHQYSIDQLSGLVEGYLGPSRLCFAPNLFPDNLPPDLEQYLIWIRNPTIRENDIAIFTTLVMQLLELSKDDVILFERPARINTRIVRGSFPQIRHLHFWSKQKAN